MITEHRQERGKTEVDRSTWIVADEALIDLRQLLGTDVPVGVGGRFEVKVIFPFLVKLGCCHIHADHHLVGEAGFLYGCFQQLQCWGNKREREGETKKERECEREM